MLVTMALLLVDYMDVRYLALRKADMYVMADVTVASVDMYGQRRVCECRWRYRCRRREQVRDGEDVCAKRTKSLSGVVSGPAAL